MPAERSANNEMTNEEKFDLYGRLLAEWNGKMNLVSKSSLADIRRRHMDDSAQLADHIPRGATVIDLGSGAGFPAVILAVLGFEVIAIESVGKKCRFLEEVKKKLDLPNLTVVNDRAEKIVSDRWLASTVGKKGGGRSDKPAPLCKNQAPKRTPPTQTTGIDAENFVFTARAFAPLIRILDWTGKRGFRYVLLKGRGAEDEIALARRKYRFRATLTPSSTGDGYVINLTME
jgi:16S rRNA (guanine527-N7)-methyltransferase